MQPPSGPFSLPQTVRRFTPDSRRWRRRIAAMAAVGSLLSFYAAFAVASGVKSGMVYNLLVLVFGVLALSLPAVAVGSLLAGDSGVARSTPSQGADAVQTLKQRYADGELDTDEFEQRLDDVLNADTVGDDDSTRDGRRDTLKRTETADER